MKKHYSVDQVKEIVKNSSSVGELHDLENELDRCDYSDDEIRELAKIIVERLVEVSGG